jgi:hypothetical protein
MDGKIVLGLTAEELCGTDGVMPRMGHWNFQRSIDSL